MTDWPGWPTFSPARAEKAIRVRALTDPLGALGGRQTSARVERERRARRAVFLAALASFAGAFAAISLRAAPPAPAAPAPPASASGDAAGRLALDRASGAGEPNMAVPQAPVARSASVQIARPAQPARRPHVRTRAS